jgi:hypothetical protein
MRKWPRPSQFRVEHVLVNEGGQAIIGNVRGAT